MTKEKILSLISKGEGVDVEFKESKIFKEIDYADEFGSDVRNLYKYSKIYGGSDPKFIEETPQVTSQDERVKAIVVFYQVPRSRQEIQEFIKIKDRKYFREAVLNPMIKLNLIEPVDKDKPNSPKQKYIAKDENV